MLTCKENVKLSHIRVWILWWLTWNYNSRYNMWDTLKSMIIPYRKQNKQNHQTSANLLQIWHQRKKSNFLGHCTTRNQDMLLDTGALSIVMSIPIMNDINSAQTDNCVHSRILQMRTGLDAYIYKHEGMCRLWRFATDYILIQLHKLAMVLILVWNNLKWVSVCNFYPDYKYINI